MVQLTTMKMRGGNGSAGDHGDGGGGSQRGREISSEREIRF
ncbi:hypothetical protein A2U01_0000203 [Trifolium medium]|uniref:Uncharacterized protein n=1 Tax=Trifolium medium TaxID=97028 RepID=A0A392LXT2_9FABA|nr:hypothetical protein [Trifolium medium]